LFAAQLPILPERRLTRDDAAAVEARMRRQSGPQWTYTDDFADAATQFRRAIQVPGAAHSALEYYRWAVRSRIRTEGRRFVEAMQRRVDLPSLLISGALDPCMLPQTVEASAQWLGGNSVSVSLATAGHYPHQEQPAKTNQVLTKFLAG
jgi:pimeloyl-ACP methyl ester carboxylesterase